MLAIKPLDFIGYFRQYHIAENCVALFKPIGCSDDLKGDILIAFYYINVRLTVTYPTVKYHRFKLVL